MEVGSGLQPQEFGWANTREICLEFQGRRKGLPKQCLTSYEPAVVATFIGGSSDSTDNSTVPLHKLREK
jgi:hypothetical protein